MSEGSNGAAGVVRAAVSISVVVLLLATAAEAQSSWRGTLARLAAQSQDQDAGTSGGAGAEDDDALDSGGRPVPAIGTPARATMDTGCLTCHDGIEPMHPWFNVSCVDCHGGDGQAVTIDRAHVDPRHGWYDDERVPHPRFEPAATRFVNPSDLRIVDQTCAMSGCHPRVEHRVFKSLHGTTAGHLNDGLYENGVLDERGSVYSIFGIEDEDGNYGEHGLKRLEPIELLRVKPRADDGIGAHFADLPRKACMQCHLWGDGVAVRGRLGQNGLYRGAGCAACHVTYADDGLSRSGDRTIDRFEPGHPIKHELTIAPPTSTCTHCHVGDAAVGNGFRGLAQLYPLMPAGPDVPNTTNALIAGQFFVEDPLLTPPDLHHAAGMHCVDCHTSRDVMGDGNIYGAMEHAVEIECTSCHGTFAETSTLRTARNRPITNIDRKGPLVTLTGKVDGRAHVVKQAAEVVDEEHPSYHAGAARAMTRAHERLECYACHAGWNTNFFGFHFDRNASFTQLDLITGKRTDGRVNTQERVFATLRRLTLGFNPDGKIAPYMVGFSTMGTARDDEGRVIVDQELPATAAGMSGMSMIHHQVHTTQRTARSCVECHRSPAAWGLGSGNPSYELARELLVAVGESGVQTALFDREDPLRTLPLARLPLGGARRVVLDSDPISGHASTAFVVIENAGVALVDVRNPAFPNVRAFAAAGDARDAALVGDLLVIANGVGGVRLVDVSDRDQPVLVSDVVTTEARGVNVQWPRVLVADGVGGLLIVDVSVPSRPRIVGATALVSDESEFEDDAYAVSSVFQFSRPQGPDRRTRAGMVAVVANGRAGYAIVDVTEPVDPFVVWTVEPRYANDADVTDVTVISRFDLGDTSGQTPTVERDVAYLTYSFDTRGQPNAEGRLAIVDVTDPVQPRRLGGMEMPSDGMRATNVAMSFNPPQLVTRLLVATADGPQFLDVTQSDEPQSGALLTLFGDVSEVAIEAFAFDKMVDETGRQLKDVSHEDSRFLELAEIHRVLTLPGELVGTTGDATEQRLATRAAYGDAAIPGGSFDRGRNLTDENERRTAMLARLSGGFRVAAVEDLARFVRPIDPTAFDTNDDLVLSRGELEKAFFAILDANDSGELDFLEWPRHPGTISGLDRNRNGIVTKTEMDLDDDVIRFFDNDSDGEATIEEWPFLVEQDPLPTLAFTSPEFLKRLFGRPGFERKRPKFYASIARAGRRYDDGPRAPHEISEEELQTRIAAARTPDAFANAPPEFLLRFDLDGDGAVEPGEHIEFERLAKRCDLDGDGDVDEGDS